MSNLDNDPFGTVQEPNPNTFELRSHVIPIYPPIKVDLTQPNRMDADIAEFAVGVEGARLVGEIVTKDSVAGLFYAKEPDYGPMIMIVEEKKGSEDLTRKILGFGESVDLSQDEGKCIVMFDVNGLLSVYADYEDTSYRISAHQDVYDPPADFKDLPFYDYFPSDFPDDPES